MVKKILLVNAICSFFIEFYAFYRITNNIAADPFKTFLNIRDWDYILNTFQVFYDFTVFYLQKFFFLILLQF